jgi:flavin-binding protein dodecin
MSVVKIIELLADSPDSWEAATQVAVTEASKTIQHIKSVYIKEMKAFVENGKIMNYRVNVKISFVVND